MHCRTFASLSSHPLEHELLEDSVHDSFLLVALVCFTQRLSVYLLSYSVDTESQWDLSKLYGVANQKQTELEQSPWLLGQGYFNNLPLTARCPLEVARHHWEWLEFSEASTIIECGKVVCCILHGFILQQSPEFPACMFNL